MDNPSKEDTYKYVNQLTSMMGEVLKRQELDKAKSITMSFIIDFLKPLFQWRSRIYGTPPKHPSLRRKGPIHCTRNQLKLMDQMTHPMVLREVVKNPRMLVDHIGALLNLLEVSEADPGELLLDKYDPKQIVIGGFDTYRHGCESEGEGLESLNTSLQSFQEIGKPLPSNGKPNRDQNSMDGQTFMYWKDNYPAFVLDFKEELKTEAARLLMEHARDEKARAFLIDLLPEAFGICSVVDIIDEKQKLFCLTRRQKLMASLAVLEKLLQLRADFLGEIGDIKFKLMFGRLASRIEGVLSERTNAEGGTDWISKMVDMMGTDRVKMPWSDLWFAIVVNLTEEARRRIFNRLWDLSNYLIRWPSAKVETSEGRGASETPGSVINFSKGGEADQVK